MIPPAVGCHLRMAAQCPRQQALWKIVKMCLTNPLFSAIMTTTMINAVMEMTSPLPVFRELPVGARRYWGSDSWLLSSPPKRSLSAVGRDGILPLQGLVFAVCMRPMLKVGAQFICRQWEWYRGSLQLSFPLSARWLRGGNGGFFYCNSGCSPVPVKKMCIFI